MSAPTEIRNVAVYCGSSSKCEGKYIEEAGRIGKLLADNGIHVIYGGGAVGLMGAVADGALAVGGRVTGIIPKFMVDVEWEHNGLTELRTVSSMHQRKSQILSASDAVVALPGGCGTLEELLEAITWKQLGLYTGPIAILNQDGFFDPCLQMLDSCIQQCFMNGEHVDMWRVSKDTSGIMAALKTSKPWSRDAIRTAPAR